MAFSTTDKEAFFALLDEYFASRPNLVVSESSQANTAGNSGPSSGRTLNSLAADVQNTLSATTASDETQAPRWKMPSAASLQSAQSNLASAGRVANAAAAFNQSQTSGPSQSTPPPRPPPRRLSSTQPSEAEQQPYHSHDSGPRSGPLVSQKKFGDVDMSSAKNMFSSLRHSTANKSAAPPSVAPPTTSAFGQKKNTFAPPPVRHVSATSPTPSRSTSATGSPASVPAQPPPPPSRPFAKEEPAGEWAEALYDYTSDDPGDLRLQENDRVLIIEKPSDDWWMGEVNGRRGLFPAAYIKLL